MNAAMAVDMLICVVTPACLAILLWLAAALLPRTPGRRAALVRAAGGAAATVGFCIAMGRQVGLLSWPPKPSIVWLAYLAVALAILAGFAWRPAIARLAIAAALFGVGFWLVLTPDMTDDWNPRTRALAIAAAAAVALGWWISLEAMAPLAMGIAAPLTAVLLLTGAAVVTAALLSMAHAMLLASLAATAGAACVAAIVLYLLHRRRTTIPTFTAAGSAALLWASLGVAVLAYGYCYQFADDTPAPLVHWAYLLVAGAGLIPATVELCLRPISRRIPAAYRIPGILVLIAAACGVAGYIALQSVAADM